MPSQVESRRRRLAADTEIREFRRACYNTAMSTPCALCFLLVAILLTSCRATGPSGGGADIQRLEYRKVEPTGERPADGWPVVIFLHGAGERGDDLSLVAVHGPLKVREEIPELQQCVILAPQCPLQTWWQMDSMQVFLDDVLARDDIDPDRIYLTGLSMGGYGTWHLIARFPDRFAAAVPVCGGGELSRVYRDRPTGFDMEGLLRALDLPIGVFHGEADSVIPVSESQVLVDALREVDANVEFTIYPGVGHDSWTETYANPELWKWMFQQDRGAR